MHLASQTVIEKNISVIIISEPTKSLVKNSNMWCTDKLLNVAIKICDRTLSVNKISKHNGFVCVELENFAIYGCYISPNITLQEFNTYLNTLRENVLSERKEVLICGDFNAKSKTWCSPIEDARGGLLSDFVSETKLIILNSGDTPTYSRGESTSYIDITMCTERLASRIKNWTVLVDENLSDHNNIIFEIHDGVPLESKIQHNTRKGWRYLDTCKEKLNETIKTNFRVCQEFSNTTITAEKCNEILTKACNETLKQKTSFKREQLPSYWWNDEIAELRRTCNKKKRIKTRNNKKRNVSEEMKGLFQREYAEARSVLRKSIKKSRNKKWKEVQDETDKDVWGMGYKIVTKQFGAGQSHALSNEVKRKIAKELFPQQEINVWHRSTSFNTCDIPAFSVDEVLTAIRKIKSGKAAGPDGVPPEVVKLAVESNPEVFTSMFNFYLLKGFFPDSWKSAALVLLEKPRKPNQTEVSYRPICLLDVTGKVFEHLLQNRIANHIEEHNCLSANQFGFRPGKSTVDALLKVNSIIKNVKETNVNYRDFLLFVALDVQNAFNSAPWTGIIESLLRINIPPYLINIICSYFENRSLIVDTETIISTTCGVPQGSVLGPTLWNIYYDSVFNIDLPLGVEVIGYADDLAILIRAQTITGLESRCNQALFQISDWMHVKKLTLAQQKTEAVLLNSNKTVKELRFEFDGTQIATQQAVKYLGVWFGHNANMSVHIVKTAARAETTANSLCALMPNIGGPRSSKRRVLSSVVHSIMLYAAPAWEVIMDVAKYKKMFSRIQRRLALRVCSAYRTTSTDAVLVIAGIPPIGLLVKERCRIMTEGIDRKVARQVVFREWQEKWNQENGKALWTKRLIRDVEVWNKRGYGETNYTLTQLLTGHGCFKAYLHRFHLADDDNCLYCGATDTAEHTIFFCPRWSIIRVSTTSALKETLTPENLVDCMLSSESSWNIINKMVRTVILTKEKEEREQKALET